MRVRGIGTATWVAIALLANSAGSAGAEGRGEVPTRIAACAGILDNLARLTCYDAVAADLPDEAPAGAPRRARRTHAGATCFAFNGEQVCE